MKLNNSSEAKVSKESIVEHKEPATSEKQK